MNKYLEAVYAKWGNDDSLLAKRNIAYAEIWDATHDKYLSLNIGWPQIHFTETPFIRNYGDFPLTDRAAQNLLSWLEGLWSLYNSQSSYLLHASLFDHEVSLAEMLNDVHREIGQLHLTAQDATAIRNLLKKPQANKKRAENSKSAATTAYVTVPRSPEAIKEAELKRRRKEAAKIAEQRRQERDAEAARSLGEHQRKLKLADAAWAEERRRRRQLRLEEPLKVEYDTPFFPFYHYSYKMNRHYKHERSVESVIAWQEEKEWAQRMYKQSRE